MDIIIAEDHDLIVDGLKSLLESHGHTISHAPDSDSLDFILANKKATVLIQDIRFGKIDARTIIPSIRQNYPDLKILALTSLDNQAIIQSVLATDVHGYVIKSEPTSVIIEALEYIQSGKIYLSKEVQTILSDSSDYLPEVQLSEREKEVLKGILDEKSTKEIAEIIFVSEKTVEHYRASLFVKFDVKNVSGLVKKAILLGFYN